MMKNKRQFIIDNDVYYKVTRFTWIEKDGHIIRYYLSNVGKEITYYLERYVWSLKRGSIPLNMRIVHINGDTWDNRIENLMMVELGKKIATVTQPLPGVSWDRERKKFQAMIQWNEKIYHLGYFNNSSQANVVYIKAKSIIEIADAHVIHAQMLLTNIPLFFADEIGN